jgi:hypothetical protein
MGAWGKGPFQNDMALDWVYELEEKGRACLVDTFDECARFADEYVDADLASYVLAAAEVVAAQLGRPRLDLPEEVRTWVAKDGAPPDQGLAAQELAQRLAD